MINEERLLKVIRVPHVSEKASNAMETTNTIVFVVAKNATKLEIKYAIKKMFKVEVKVVNTLIVKGKTIRRKMKRYRQNNGLRSNWKKAYVSLKEGDNLNFIRTMLSKSKEQR